MSVFIIDKSLVELRNGELIESDIILPKDTYVLVSSIDNGINAMSEVSEFILIYELVGRQFELKHSVGKYLLGVETMPIDLDCCYYIQGLLIILHRSTGANLFTIIDLKTTDIILICYGSPPQYCDGVLTFPPINPEAHQTYHNINMADKTITTTKECPYFLNPIKCITDKYKGPLIKVAACITIIDNEHFYTITGTKLGTGITVESGDSYYITHFIKTNKMEIAPGAPIVEYEYKGKYLYVFTSAAGKHTKAAGTAF